jgi:parallel beta-helix repeat protein
MEQAKTHLGSPELHKRHSVMIEGGAYPRGKVLDQLIFDRYLMEGLITLAQHRSAEFLLNMAARAGVWATGARLDGVYTDTPKQSKVFFGMMPFGNALTKIRDECGECHYRFTKAVIIDNNDVRSNNEGIKLFSDSMEFVNNNIVFFHKNPLRHLE